jgi:hypothetical protein
LSSYGKSSGARGVDQLFLRKIARKRQPGHYHFKE